MVHLRSAEAFLLTVVLFCLGMSWVTSHFGLSLALGAFIAGMVLADSDYSHQVTAEILPFRDVFNSLFFVSIDGDKFEKHRDTFAAIMYSMKIPKG